MTVGTVVYTADWICPIAAPPVRNGAMAVSNGVITEVGKAEDVAGESRVAFPGCALIPGFVNAHAHLELTILRGLLENLPFMEWIRRLTHIKYQLLTRDDLKLSADLGAVEMLRAGVTAVGEVMDIGTGWESMQEFGLQGIAYQEVFGPDELAVPDALRGLREKVERCRNGESATQRVGVSPHAPYTVSRPLYLAVRDYVRAESLRMTAHIGESRSETLFVRDGTGPFAEAHARRGIAVTARGCMPVEYFDRLGILGPDMLLVHCVEADEDDLNSIRASGSGVAHCPKSNAKLANASGRVRDMRAHGVGVGLGTDSVASNNAIDMFEEMRAAIFQQRTLTGDVGALSADDAFRMATLDAAHCLGIEKHAGSLEVGKRADFAVVDLSRVSTQPSYSPIETMVYSASRADVRAVFQAGREFIFDDSEMLQRVERIAERLGKTAG